MKIEILSLVANLVITAWYCYYWQGLGKPMYWASATFISASLWLMKG